MNVHVCTSITHQIKVFNRENTTWFHDHITLFFQLFISFSSKIYIIQVGTYHLFLCYKK